MPAECVASLPAVTGRTSLRGMTLRTCMWIGVAWVVPAIGLVQEVAAPVIAPYAFDLRSQNVQQIVRARANSQGTGITLEQALQDELAVAAVMKVAGLCSGSDCFDGFNGGYDPWPGFSFPHDRSVDAWLRCQQYDDMLSTFERYERCNVNHAPPRRITDARIRLDTDETRTDSGPGQLGSKARDFALQIADTLKESQRDSQPSGVQFEVVPQSTGGSGQGDDTRTELKSAIRGTLRR